MLCISYMLPAIDVLFKYTTYYNLPINNQSIIIIMLMVEISDMVNATRFGSIQLV